MKVLMVIPRYDYGKVENGFSLEELYMVRSLRDMNVDVSIFDFPSIIDKYGKQITNEMLRTRFTDADYDVMVYVPFVGTEIDEETWNYVEPNTKKVLWMFNDVWRFELLGQELCWAFDYVVTDDPGGCDRYDALDSGVSTLYLPRAVRIKWFEDSLSEDKPVDVCFIGQQYGGRLKLVMDIMKGLPDTMNAMVGGLGNPKVSWNQYVQTMCQSKIVLSPSEASQGGSFQLKARTLEGMAAGAVVLTDCSGFEEHTGNYPIVFDFVQTAIDKIVELLGDDDRRKKIAKAGQDFAFHRGECDYHYRFVSLFTFLGV